MSAHEKLSLMERAKLEHEMAHNVTTAIAVTLGARKFHCRGCLNEVILQALTMVMAGSLSDSLLDVAPTERNGELRRLSDNVGTVLSNVTQIMMANRSESRPSGAPLQ